MIAMTNTKSKPAEAARTRRPWTRVRLAAAVAACALALAFAADAAACPVCFGETDEHVAQGVRWSMVFLGGLVYLVIGGGLAMFLALRRRARRLQDPRRGLRLVQSGTPS